MNLLKIAQGEKCLTSSNVDIESKLVDDIEAKETEQITSIALNDNDAGVSQKLRDEEVIEITSHADEDEVSSNDSKTLPRKKRRVS